MITESWLLENGVSSAQLAEALGRKQAAPAVKAEPVSVGPVVRRGKMNATEARFASEVLDYWKAEKLIKGYAFEGLKFLIAVGIPADPVTGQKGIRPSYYTPDFYTWNDREIVVYEIKGHWREAARLRIKVAAERHPWLRILGVRRISGEWSYERFS